MARTPDKPDRRPPAVPTKADDGESAARRVEQIEKIEIFNEPAQYRIGQAISRAAQKPRKRRLKDDR